MKEADVKEQLDDILSQYSGVSADLITVLQEVQEKFGYLPEKAMQIIAKFLRLPRSTVYGVATFYAQFKFVPTGERIVKVCRGTACHVRGGERVLSEVETQLGIKSGETTDDLKYSIETIACIGCCALAPCLRINNNVHGEVTPERARKLFHNVNKGEQGAQ